MKKKTNLILIGLLVVLLLLIGWFVGFKMAKSFLEKTLKNRISLVDEESVTTKVVEKSSASVVTVSANKDVVDSLSLDAKNVEQDIGTGFIVSSDGLIVTNKHVVADTSAKYKVVIGTDEVVEVKNIYRDPVNDLAILKVDKANLTPVELGDSDELKVGQTVIAIGTALGEFRSTVTKGVISGLGRGITASGDGVTTEKLDGIIQTDAAINPGIPVGHCLILWDK
jgi:S1-C subfamily serine protease